MANQVNTQSLQSFVFILLYKCTIVDTLEHSIALKGFQYSFVMTLCKIKAYSEFSMVFELFLETECSK